MTAHTPFSIAAGARLASAAAVFGLVFLAGCSVLPTPPARPVVYDFGPGLPVAPAGQPEASNGNGNGNPAMPVARLPTLALADVQSVGRSDNSTAVLYRLAYTDARQLRPYQLARWSLPPAQLVQQALRTQLAERRAVLNADDALAAAREGASTGTASRAGSAGSLPTVLRVELEEFSQVFTSASASSALVRLRATLVEPTADGEKLLGQRLFAVQTPAPSADAAGGTRALADATAQAAQAMAQWVEQLGH